MKFMLFLICVVTTLVLLSIGLVWYLSATTEITR
jgi:hypothetical protein